MAGIFGDTKLEILQYTVSLTDQADVARIQAQLDALGSPSGIIMAPTLAATTYKAPIQEETDVFAAPCIRSPWFVTQDNFPRDKATFKRDSGGFWGFLTGDTTEYVWCATFRFAPSATTEPVIGTEAVVPISARRWLDGFEHGGLAEGPSGQSYVARGASRHLQGYGWRIDRHTVIVQHQDDESGRFTGSSPQGQWERFYIRIHRYPTAKTRIWRCSKRPGAVIGNELAVTPNGQLALSGLTAEFDTGSLIGSAADPVPLHVWTKIDIQFCYAAGVSTSAPRGAYCDVFVNGLLAVSGTAGNSFNSNDSAFRSYMGSPSAHDLLIDIDDWVGADIPNHGSVLTVFPSRDWNAGSRIALVGATGYGSDHNAAVWATGDWRLLRMRPLLQSGITIPRVIATGQGRLTLATDAAGEIDQAKNGIGIAALTVLAHCGKTGSADGTLGWRLPDGTTTLKAITQGVLPSLTWNRAYFTPAGIQPLTPLEGLELIYEPATPNHNIDGLWALAEIIGVHGQEDVVEKSPIPGTVETIPEKVGIHNAPYPRSPWASRGTAPQSPVIIHSGTYVGTGTYVDLAFRAPVTFLWIRNTTVAGNGAQWWTACNSGHIGGAVHYRPEGPVQALVNPNWVTPQAPVPTTQPPDIATTDPQEVTARVRWWLQEADSSDSEMYWMDAILYDPEPGHTPGWTADSYWSDKIMAGEGAGLGYDNTAGQQEMQILVRIVGADAAHNLAGVTYHYLAFCDPGLRFCESGALEVTQGTGDYVHNLESETFTPDACFLQIEQPGASSTVGLHFKGLGHAASALSPANAAEITPALKMALGALTYQSALASSASAHLAHLAFRRDDKSGDPGVPRVVQILTYTGDGSASRTIGLSPLTGRRPLFAIIVPHNAAWYFRDPLHTGTTCTQFPGNAVASGGIVSGNIDQINVGATLNANAVVYEVFCFVGSATAGNNGWSIIGEYIPVSPAGLAGEPPWDDNPAPVEPPGPDVPDGQPIPGDGFPGASGADDFSATCIGPSTTIINQALSRLGISKRVVSIKTDLTQEADTARLHYVEDVARTLRDVPWPFATRHAALQLVTGVSSPDWAYAYRQPTDCVFERRLIAPRSGAVDPTPPPFQLSSDAQGGLIFCNVASATLEYTYRPPCAAGIGDALFREALGWRHALSLAPALSRMTEAAAACEKMYEQTIAKARAILTPGVPGVLPPAPTVDLSPSAQAANTAVVNRALVRIGAQTITALATDQSRGAVAARTLFEDELQTTLRDYAWSFATAYATLTKVAGTPTLPVNGDWLYSYRVPVALLAARRLVTALGRLEQHPPKFALGADATGALLFTNETPATLEYTTRVEACVEQADAVFRDALAWRLAASLAPTIGQASPEVPEQLGRGPDDLARPRERPSNLAQYRQTLSRQAWQMYAYALDTARRTNANEGEQEDWPDAPWIQGR